VCFVRLATFVAFWRRGAAWRLETETAAFRLGRWGHQLPDGRDERMDGLVMSGNGTLQFGEFVSQFLVAEQHFAQLHERSHHEKTDSRQPAAY